jgi:hypothetical protein
MIHMLNQPIIDDIYPGGLFFDNTAKHPLRVEVISGGGVAEHPQHLGVTSQTFVDWYWSQGVAPFMIELAEHLENNPGTVGNRSVTIIPNVANVPPIVSQAWEDSYVNPPVADILFMEFEYNPTRDHGMNLPEVIYSKHSQAIAAGVGIFETGFKATTVSGRVGSFSDEEALMNVVAGHWVHRAPDLGTGAATYLLGNNVWDLVGNLNEWEWNLKPVFDIDLGAPAGPPFILDSGTDPSGNAYRVYARQLACGLAIVRHRHPWDGDFDATSAVTVDLGGSYLPLTMDGETQTLTSSWSLRNGQGQVFLSSTIFEDDFESGGLDRWSSTGH